MSSTGVAYAAKWYGIWLNWSIAGNAGGLYTIDAIRAPSDNKIRVVGTVASGGVWMVTQPAGGAFSGSDVWASLNCCVFDVSIAAHPATGLLTISGRSSDWQIWSMTQTAPGAGLAISPLPGRVVMKL